MATFEFLTETGTVIVDTAQIKSDVEAEYLSFPGVTGLPDPSSFEGRLLDAEVTSRVSVARNNAKLANQMNPNLASGTFLDAQLAFIGSERDGQTKSTVQCTLTGVVGTIIPAGSLAQDTTDEKNIWVLSSEVTIPAGGSIDASFESQEYGPVTANTGQITKIISGVVGWETIANAAPATLGKSQQLDPSARMKRKRELGANSRTVTYSIIAAISAVDNVQGVRFLENTTNTEQTISDVVMSGHSTWVCVDGGDDADIAEAYVSSKSGGSGFNGAVSVTYIDPDSSQPIPVQFDRPTPVPMICRITVRPGTSSLDDIKNAVADYASGLVPGESGFSLGEDASPFEIAAGVNALLPDVFVTRCELAKQTDGSGAYSTSTVNILIYEKATLLASDVEVVAV